MVDLKKSILFVIENNSRIIGNILIKFVDVDYYIVLFKIIFLFWKYILMYLGVKGNIFVI